MVRKTKSTFEKFSFMKIYSFSVFLFATDVCICVVNTPIVILNVPKVDMEPLAM